MHIGLRYDPLDAKARKAVFKVFIERVRVASKIGVSSFTEADYITLAKSNLNGRQIKNTVFTAQALAVQERQPLNMEHIRHVLDVHRNFEKDLKGGPGYEDAMRGFL